MHQQLVTECQALATNLNHREFKIWLIRLIIATFLSQSLLINALSQSIFPAVLWRMDLWPLFYQELEWSYLPASKDPDAGKDWGKEEKQATEDEMVGWYHRLKGYEFEQTLGDSEGQGSLMCCSPWSCKELNMNGVYSPLVCGHFSDLPCFWRPWQCWEVMVRHFVESHTLDFSVFFFFFSHC